MSSDQKQENRGGYRPNAGRKPGKQVSLGAYQAARLLRKVRRYAKNNGKDPDDLLLDIIYSKEEKTNDRLVGMKLLKEFTTPKITEGSETDKALGPAVFLPEQRPVLTAVDGGKAA
jgi:DNA primase